MKKFLKIFGAMTSAAFAVSVLCAGLEAPIAARAAFSADAAAELSEEEKGAVGKAEPYTIIDEDNYNIVSKDYATGAEEKIYFDNTMVPYLRPNSPYFAASLSEKNTPTASVLSSASSFGRTTVGYPSEEAFSAVPDPNSLIPVADTSDFPYSSVARVRAEYDDIKNNDTGAREKRIIYTTAFFVGPDVLLTAGHCIYKDVTRADATTPPSNMYEDGITNPRFPDRIYIEPATYTNAAGEQVYPFGQLPVKRAYIGSEYQFYTNRTIFLSEAASYDWGVCVLENDTVGYQTGWSGIVENYSFAQNETAKNIGYPCDNISYDSSTMYYNENKKNVNTTEELVYREGKVIGGMSGGPMEADTKTEGILIGCITIADFETSVVGKRIDSFLFDFILCLTSEDIIDVKNWYYNERNEKIEYNCLVKMIINIGERQEFLATKNLVDFEYLAFEKAQRFFPAKTDEAQADFPYLQFKIYNRDTGNYSVTKNFSGFYPKKNLQTKYAIKYRTHTFDVIDTDFDKSDNLWTHGGSSSQKIKGTVYYNNCAKNIETEIPLLGTKTSSVELGGVIFQLRCGPNKVSLKASKALSCTDLATGFAFAVV